MDLLIGTTPGKSFLGGPNAITVGVPVYNNASTLRRTVESVLAQTRPATSILLSDDQSTDESQRIGEGLAAAHDRVTYVRRPENVGHTLNFHWLVHAATTPYFMWLAGDDLILPTYLERMADRLDADPELIGCVSLVQFTVEGKPTTLATGSEPLSGPPRDAVARYLDDPAANARLYGLFRRAILATTVPARHLHAWDWASMAATLKHGAHGRVDEVLMVRDETPSSNYVKAVGRDNKGRLDRIFPLAPMTRELLFRQRIPLDSAVLRALIKINLQSHCSYMAAFHPRYSNTIGRVLRKNLWRISPARQLDRRGAVGPPLK